MYSYLLLWMKKREKEKDIENEGKKIIWANPKKKGKSDKIEILNKNECDQSVHWPFI